MVDMNAPCLVLGACGQLGRALVERPTVPPIIGLGRQSLDITDATALAETIGRLRPAVVVNAAAYTAVDRAEQEPDRAFAVNRDGAASVAEACAEHGVPLIHVSTDYVFDGRAAWGNREGDRTAPINVYGRSKLAGEIAIRDRLPHHVIVRTSWLCGARAPNFLTAILAKAATEPEIQVVADQRGCPTLADDLAGALLTLAERIAAGDGRWGTVHYAGMPPTTWFDLAGLAVELAARWKSGHWARVVPITSAELNRPASRPAVSILLCERIKRDYGLTQPDWRKRLKDVVGRIVCK